MPRTKAEHDAAARGEAQDSAREFLAATKMADLFSAQTVAAMEDTLVTMMMQSYNTGAMAGIDMLDAALPRFS